MELIYRAEKSADFDAFASKVTESDLLIVVARHKIDHLMTRCFLHFASARRKKILLINATAADNNNKDNNENNSNYNNNSNATLNGWINSFIHDHPTSFVAESPITLTRLVTSRTR